MSTVFSYVVMEMLVVVTVSTMNFLKITELYTFKISYNICELYIKMNFLKVIYIYIYPLFYCELR